MSDSCRHCASRSTNNNPCTTDYLCGSYVVHIAFDQHGAESFIQTEMCKYATELLNDVLGTGLYNQRLRGAEIR